MDDDLTLISTDDLLAELKSRFDNMAFMAVKDLTDISQGSIYDWQCKDMLAGVGAVRWLETLMLAQWDRNRRPAEEL